MVTKIRVRRLLSGPEGERIRESIGSRLIRFTVASDAAVDPAQYDLYVAEEPRSRVIALGPELPSPVEIEWDPAQIRALAGGCEYLAGTQRRGR
jgi:hypothetical protein